MMNYAQQAGLVLVATAALFGCAEMQMQWQKSGADPAVLRNDLADCQMTARTGALHQSQVRIFSPSAGLPAESNALRFQTEPPVGGEGTRYLAEYDLTRACMQQRGYALEPVKR
jgi:hypothetical protein